LGNWIGIKSNFYTIKMLEVLQLSVYVDRSLKFL
jgi:hypothetical protein